MILKNFLEDVGVIRGKIGWTNSLKYHKIKCHLLLVKWVCISVCVCVCGSGCICIHTRIYIHFCGEKARRKSVCSLVGAGLQATFAKGSSNIK